MSDILQAADATAEGGYVPSDNGKAVIKVIGVGGGGGNTVQHMINEEVTNPDDSSCLDDRKIGSISWTKELGSIYIQATNINHTVGI